MSVWGAAAGGFVRTLALTTVLRAAGECGLTRMDLPFLLGTAVTTHRSRAKAVGYLVHFLSGELFAFTYYAVFLALGRAGWGLGALFGLGHGLFSVTALVNVVLPVVHPRMGSTLTSAPRVALLEPPGFLMRNYGPATAVVTVLVHVGYGALVGGFAATGG